MCRSIIFLNSSGIRFCIVGCVVFCVSSCTVHMVSFTRMHLAPPQKPENVAAVNAHGEVWLITLLTVCKGAFQTGAVTCGECCSANIHLRTGPQHSDPTHDYVRRRGQMRWAKCNFRYVLKVAAAGGLPVQLSPWIWSKPGQKQEAKKHIKYFTGYSLHPRSSSVLEPCQGCQ